MRCGFYARCALEVDDSSEIRLTKIFRVVGECRFGIHDLSRTQLDKATRLPRFNMPLELGIFLAAKYYGKGEQDKKSCLIFERRAHSYEKFISDIKGQDIVAHENKLKTIVGRIRDWLAANTGRRALPGGHAIWRDYMAFGRWLPNACRQNRLRENDLTFDDFVNLVYKWMETH
jgi:hypothetical protein